MKEYRFVNGILILLLLIFGAKLTKGEILCDPNDVYGSIICGDRIDFRSDIGGHQSFVYRFDAIEGEVWAFMAEAPLYPDQSIMIWVSTEDCTIIFAVEPPYPDVYGEICPFFAPKSGTYRLGINVYGSRGHEYKVSAMCLDPNDVDCGYLPIERRTWGLIKAYYK